MVKTPTDVLQKRKDTLDEAMNCIRQAMQTDSCIMIGTLSTSGVLFKAKVKPIRIERDAEHNRIFFDLDEECIVLPAKMQHFTDRTNEKDRILDVIREDDGDMTIYKICYPTIQVILYIP